MNKLNVNLSRTPDFYMEAVVSLYERKWNQTEVIVQSELKYGKTKEELMEKFGKLRLYRDTVISEIEASGYDFTFIDRFIESDVDKFPYLLRLYFHCRDKRDFSYTDGEADQIIGDFVLDRIYEVVDSGAKLSKVSGIGEIFNLLNSPLIDSAERMLYLDTYGNGRQLVAAIREYMKIAVPILEKHFDIIRDEFEKELEIHDKVEDWRSFSGKPQALGLPSAPEKFLTYFEEDNRPQTGLDRDLYGGMGVSLGRLREDFVYDYKFVGLSHNTLRGAAGGAVLIAELLYREGYFD